MEALHLGEGGKRGMEVEGEEEEAEGEGEWQRQSKAGPAAPGGSQIPIKKTRKLLFFITSTYTNSASVVPPKYKRMEVGIS